MQTPLLSDEQVIKEGPANLQKNVETVGGKLCLTNRRLFFEAHSMNVQGGTTEIDILSVKSVSPCWTKFLGLIPLFPNSLSVVTDQGKDYRFVLFGRHQWADMIEAARHG